MKSYPVIFLFFLFLTSCESHETPFVPTIERGKMAEMLADLHLSEVVLQSVVRPRRDTLQALYYREIFEKYNIKEAEFYENQEIYFSNPAETQKLYEQIIQILEEKQKKVAN